VVFYRLSLISGRTESAGDGCILLRFGLTIARDRLRLRQELSREGQNRQRANVDMLGGVQLQKTDLLHCRDERTVVHCPFRDPSPLVPLIPLVMVTPENPYS
jgi:hypothetical protein